MKSAFEIAADQLFEGTVKIWINPIIQMAITPAPEFIDNTSVDVIGMARQGVTVTVHNPNEEYIRDRLMGRNMDTGDEETDALSSNEYYQASRTINDVIEIWELQGEVLFIDIQEMLTTFDIADKYLHMLNERVRYSPNFNGSEELSEDIRKITSLTEDLKYLADKYRTVSRSRDSVSQLFDKLRRTSFTAIGTGMENAVVANKRGIANDKKLNIYEIAAPR